MTTHLPIEPAIIGAVLTFELENDASQIGPLVAYLQSRAAEQSGFDESAQLQLAIALQEALANALYHGNLELSSAELLRATTDLSASEWQSFLSERAARQPYRDRRILVRARFASGRAEIVVRDEGPGFDPTTLLDPTSDEGLVREHGRGVYLMQALMDEVRYSASGNTVTLVKRGGELGLKRAG